MEKTLYRALCDGDLADVKRINAIDQTALTGTYDGIPLSFYAARGGYLELVRYIVEYSRVSLDLVDSANKNMLHYAAMSGNVALCRYLTERVGMDPCSSDAYGETPYGIAYSRKDSALCDYFAQQTGAKYEEMYANPIRRGFFPDPSILRVGDDYYMVNSSFIYFPCIPISHSRDLIHWEIIGHAITDPSYVELDTLEGGRGFWAPDISYDNGRFYITATYRLNDVGPVYRRQMIVSSDRPEGPYSRPAFIEEDGIDPSLFHEDGRHYMLLNRGARILELNADCTERISEASLLYYGDHKRAPEGPHLLKKDGYYYLFEAEGGTGPGHRITVARSRELMGRYEPCPYNPILRQTDEGACLQRAGHGKPVMTPDGKWYMVYLCGRSLRRDVAASERDPDLRRLTMLGRETAIDPITWTADGWPIVNGLKGPSALNRRPILQAGEVVAHDEKKLYVTPRTPTPDGITICGSGFVLHGSRRPMNEPGAKNILLRRQQDFAFEAQALVSFGEGYELPKQGQEIGLTCYYDENSWVNLYAGCERDGYKYFVTVKEHIGYEDIQHDKVYIELGGESSLLLGVRTEGLRRSFYVKGTVASGNALAPDNVRANATSKAVTTNSADAGIIVADLPDVYYLSDEGVRMGKRFTGAMVGMYCYAGEEKLSARFASFSYIPESENR